MITRATPCAAAVAALFLAACPRGEWPGGDPGADPVVRPDDTKPLRVYYSVRPDLRRCVAPLCGGYWVSALNRDRTRCADGTDASECYVSELHAPAGVAFSRGDLAIGELAQQRYPELGLSLGILRAQALLSPVVESGASGVAFEPDTRTFGLIYDTGVRCVTTPCPSQAFAWLNRGTTFSDFGYVLAGDAQERASMDRALSDELAGVPPLGAGAVVVGELETSRRSGRAQLEVANVYATKRPLDVSPVCVVHTTASSAAAWNIAPAEEGRIFADSLGEGAVVYKGKCDELVLPCTLEVDPVHGTIEGYPYESDGECIEAANRCEFRAQVVKAAQGGKAEGRFRPGPCPSADACESDDDCATGFCGWDADGQRLCRPWAGIGERCEGFVLPQDRRFCDPRLTCEYLEATGDAGGVCVLPGAQFPCGDQGLTCDSDSEYCHITVGGVPLPDAGAPIIPTCVDAGECVGANATCDCLAIDVGPLTGTECNDNGGLPPVVTLYAP